MSKLKYCIYAKHCRTVNIIMSRYIGLCRSARGLIKLFHFAITESDRLLLSSHVAEIIRLRGLPGRPANQTYVVLWHLGCLSVYCPHNSSKYVELST